MSDFDTLIDRYIAAWNETDAATRTRLIAKIYAEDASYRDPALKADGHGEIDAMVVSVHERFPGHRFRLTSDIDAHNDRLRFSWELGPEVGAPIVKGIDFAVIADGRLREVTGFFTEVATQPSS